MSRLTGTCSGTPTNGNRDPQQPISRQEPAIVHGNDKWVAALIPKSRFADWLRRNEPLFRQHFLKRLPEPQGQRSLRPSFSSSSLSPWTMRTPRLTRVSDGKPRRRLFIVSKKRASRRIRACSRDTSLSGSREPRRHATRWKVRLGRSMED
jgi:hypothetical protein